MSQDRTYLLENARKLVGNCPELPTIPDIVFRVSNMLHNPKVEFGEVADLVAHDQVLATRILRIANSVYYGHVQSPSIKDAAIRLGVSRLQEMMFTCAIVDLFKPQSGCLDRAILWAHALGVARISQLVAEHLQHPEPGSVYAAGLLHDIGEVFLHFYLSPVFISIRKEVILRKCGYYEAEERIIGTTHSEVGYILCDQWEISHLVGEPILRHHQYEEVSTCTDNRAVIVAFADWYCNKNHMDYELYLPETEPWETLSTIFPIAANPAWQTELMDTLNNEVKSMRESIEILFALHFS